MNFNEVFFDQIKIQNFIIIIEKVQIFQLIEMNMKRYLISPFKQLFWFSQRKIIEPQAFQAQKFQDFFLVRSKTYQFLISRLPDKQDIYRHETQTPAAVLKRPGIHIFPNQIPQINRREKYQAVNRKIQDQYQKSFNKCIQPSQIFHLNRKIKSQIKRKLQFIGVVHDKYKQYLLFQPYQNMLKQKTKEQYLKKGVKVACLDGITIYPKGEVWMPTNQKYLIDFIEALKQMESQKNNIQNILDLGCGSGILSFLSKKSFKKAKIIGFDVNPAAVDTVNINAAEHQFSDVKAFHFDLKNVKDFEFKLQQEKLPTKYDLILINPPWLHAKKLALESPLQEGVYDENGQMLSASLSIASSRLRDSTSKIFLIYSDLNKILGLERKSVQQICKQNALLIVSVKQRPLMYNIESRSVLNQFKQKSKIMLYEIKKS